MSFQLPESVRLYISDAAVRDGVDAVLGFGAKRIPPGLGWEELPRFYAASLAGVTVQTEYAVVLTELWGRIWPERIDGWRAQSIDEQSVSAFDAKVIIPQVWDHGFGRLFVRDVQRPQGKRAANGAMLWLGVALDEEGISVGFWRFPPDDRDVELDGFSQDEEEIWWSPPLPVLGEQIDLSAVRAHAGDVLAWIAASSG